MQARAPTSGTVLPLASSSVPHSARAVRPSRSLAVNAEAACKAGLREAVLRATAAVGVASWLVLAGPSHAGLDTDTTKKGVGATIEYSDISKEPAGEVVRKLKEEVLPTVTEKLGAAAKKSGSSRAEYVVQELKTVEGEGDALDRQAAGGGGASNVKSAASGIEQQINALKAMMGFD